VIRATLDVNVLVSGFPAERGTPAELIERWSNLEYELVLSEHILDGIARAWQKPYYRRRIGAEQIQETLRVLRTESTIVEPVRTVRDIAKDEEDDLVIATAVAGGADYLVTGDRYLQSLGRYQAVTILSPRQFLDRLDIEPRPSR
jgi:putative PIN family toxin of toxin-antitoxin system